MLAIKQTRFDSMETVRPGNLVNWTDLKSVGERQRNYLSVIRPIKRVTHELYVIFKAMRM